MTPIEAIGLAVAAFIAGAVNGVAGGGSLLSFPALLAFGLPAKTANVTNTVALWPGYVGGVLGYRSLLASQRGTVTALSVSSILGALTGAAILLLTSQAAFRAIVPYLVLFGALVLAFQSKLGALIARFRRPWTPGDPVPPEAHPVIFLLGVYGAYFGAGLGTMTLAALSILLPDDLQRSNALKSMLSLVINAIAVLVFVFSGFVAWLPALIMAVAALAGGYIGVGFARRLSARLLKAFVVGYSLAIAARLFELPWPVAIGVGLASAAAMYLLTAPARRSAVPAPAR
ncbi:MAG: sulfite exporter TauE/SafE family protein [Dehalococcoidia bacterium]